VVCEGQLLEWLIRGFSLLELIFELLKKLSWSKPPARWGGAVLPKWYYNFIAKTNENNIKALWWIIILNYVTQLGEKNYWRKLLSVRVFSKNCASNFFWSVGQEGRPKSKTSFHQWTKKNVLSTENGISEMKQSKNWC
jgi:hypothetical protein